MLGYANISNYGPSWWEWGGGGSGSVTSYPCTGTDTGCDPDGDINNNCPQPTVDTDAALYFPLDEGGGTIAFDSSANGNDGILKDLDSLNADGDTPPIWTADSKLGPYALWFDGTDDYIEVADSPSLDVTSGFTFAAWIKPNEEPLNEATHMKTLISKGDNAIGDNFFLVWYCIATELFQFKYTTPDASSIAVFSGYARSNFADGTWKHIGVTNDGSTAKIYIDGTETATAGVSPMNSNNDPLMIGKAAALADRFEGNMDEVYVFNRALSADEIVALMNK